MVERETVAPEERRLVAAVIYSRLDRDMPLGIDATLRYGLGIQGTAADEDPSREQLAVQHAPVPAVSTPINDDRVVRAAAAKLPVDYLYVRRPDRSYFTPRTTKSSAGRRASTATPANHGSG